MPDSEIKPVQEGKSPRDQTSQGDQSAPTTEREQHALDSTLHACFFAPEPSPRKAVAWFAAFSVALHVDKLVLGPAAAIRFHDTFDSEFPRLLNLARYLSDFGLVEWYPNLAGGLPVNAFHYTLLHPLVLLSTVFPPWLIQTTLVLGPIQEKWRRPTPFALLLPRI